MVISRSLTNVAQADPFFTGSCTPVACPEHSTGTNVPGGCECLAGADSAPVREIRGFGSWFRA